jgi:hypothetical protein
LKKVFDLTQQLFNLRLHIREATSVDAPDEDTVTESLRRFSETLLEGVDETLRVAAHLQKMTRACQNQLLGFHFAANQEPMCEDLLVQDLYIRTVFNLNKGRPGSLECRVRISFAE